MTLKVLDKGVGITRVIALTPSVWRIPSVLLQLFDHENQRSDRTELCLECAVVGFPPSFLSSVSLYAMDVPTYYRYYKR